MTTKEVLRLEGRGLPLAGRRRVAPVAAAPEAVWREPIARASLLSLDHINQRFGRLLGARFDALLWRGTHAQVSAARSASFCEAIAAIGDASLCAQLRARGVRGDGFLALGSALAHGIAERLRGGGRSGATARRSHPQLEPRTLHRVVAIIVAAYEAAWRPQARVSFVRSPLRAGRVPAEASDPASMVAVFDVRFSVGSVAIDDFSMLLPGALLSRLGDAAEYPAVAIAGDAGAGLVAAARVAGARSMPAPE